MNKLYCVKCDNEIHGEFYNSETAEPYCYECGNQHLTTPEALANYEYPYSDPDGQYDYYQLTTTQQLEWDKWFTYCKRNNIKVNNGTALLNWLEAQR